MNSSVTLTRSICPSALHQATDLAPGDRALADPAHGQPAEVGGTVEVGHQGLERVPLLVGGGRDVLDEQLEEGLQRCPRRPPASSDAQPSRALA